MPIRVGDLEDALIWIANLGEWCLTAQHLSLPITIILIVENPHSQHSKYWQTRKRRRFSLAHHLPLALEEICKRSIGNGRKLDLVSKV